MFSKPFRRPPKTVMFVVDLLRPIVLLFVIERVIRTSYRLALKMAVDPADGFGLWYPKEPDHLLCDLLAEGFCFCIDREGKHRQGRLSFPKAFSGFDCYTMPLIAKRPHPLALILARIAEDRSTDVIVATRAAQQT